MKRKWFWRRQMALWDAMLTLAAWRWRTQRFLLFITGLGVTVAVVLLVSLPLFSNVMATAGLRGVLRSQAASSRLLLTAAPEGISADLIANDAAQINNLVQQDAGRYLAQKPLTTLITGNWFSSLTVNFYGVPIQQARSHLKLLQGRLPAANASSATSIDIMLTSTAAFYLGRYKVGDMVLLRGSLLTGPDNYDSLYNSQIKARIVGIFQVQANDPFWNGYTLEEPTPSAMTPPPPVLALTDQASLLHMFDSLQKQHQGFGVYFADRSPCSFFLSYQVNSSTLVSSQLDDLIASLGHLQEDISQDFQGDPFSSDSNIGNVILSGPLVHDSQPGGSSILEKYRTQIQIMQTPALILTSQILCLILFFISVMITALVEREQLAIAVLRSRGANRRQVSGSLIMQGLVLCVLAGLLGPLLALGVAYLILPHILTPTTQDALNVFTLDFRALLPQLGLYTVAAVSAAFSTLLLTIFLAVRANILTQRREETRATRLPLWQRLRLDLIVAVLAVAGYLTTYYLENTQQFLSLQGQVLVSVPLELLAPVLLLVAGILFFLRLFPLLLRLLARIAQRRRGLISMLALAQMERAPRQSMRMALLLGLASAFTLFALVFSASQGQRAQDLANYQAVSDFSGYNHSLPLTVMTSSKSLTTTENDVLDNARTALQQATGYYQQIRGVTSASVGSMNTFSLTLNAGSSQSHAWETRLLAIDPATYGCTAQWSTQDSEQSLANLMNMLIARRAQAIQNGLVPALVASNTWQQLGLSQGVTFHMSDEGGNLSATTYIAIAEIKHIPPIDDGSEGAVIVDYQSLVAGQIQGEGLTQTTEVAQLNYVWLRSSDAAVAINHVRAALNTTAFALVQMIDRRALSAATNSDPLANGLLSTISIGVAATLLLAFVANLLLPLLSVRMRQTNFAVLRALGTAPAQVTGILTWELAIVLVTSLLLGLLFGTMLAFTSVPPLVFSGSLPANLVNASSSTIYTLQRIIPVTIVVPLSLVTALLVLLLLCVFALSLMSRLAQRPLMAQVLRLDED
ncbi:MAG TPA: FtsX-like permease family protein [Ktedonobacteraceae bacterium]